MTSYRDVSVDVGAIVEDIRSIVEVESPTSHPAGVNRVLDIIAGWFEGTGAGIERRQIDDRFGDILKVCALPSYRKPSRRRGYPGPREASRTANDPGSDRRSPLARTAPAGLMGIGNAPGPASATGILVLSHVDTVHPLGTLAGPLPMRREGDRLYGPGVFDMKGGLTLAVAAFRRLAHADITCPLPITFMFTPDEEVGSVASRKHIEAEAVRHQYVLVTEPMRAGGRVVTSRKGTGRFLIEAHGRPAHAGTAHDKGRSAIRAMARIILDIESFTDHARGITTNVGLISGGTGVNVIPEYCRINADMRIPDLQAAAEMEARFHALASPDPGVEIKVDGGMLRPPFERSGEVDRLFDLAAAVAATLGFTLESGPRTGGGSDGNFTAALGLPTLDGLGVEGDGAHTTEEHLLVSSIERGTRLMQGLFETLR
jgi:glutamate carboxypeptidase